MADAGSLGNNPEDQANFQAGWQAAVAIKGRTLFEAVKRNDEELVKRIIQDGLPAANVNPKGQTAAHIATRSGNMAILQFLLSVDGSVVQMKDKTGRNLLHIAVENGFIDIVRYLMDEYNLDIYNPDNFFQGNNIAHLAVLKNYENVLRYLIEEKHVDVNVLNEKGEPLVFLAAAKKNYAMVRHLVERYHADLTLVDYEQCNVLFPATKSGDETVLVYVLDDKKVDLHINWQDHRGRTVLHWAAFSNRVRIARYLVDIKHADVNALDFMGETPLHLAAGAGHIRLVELLYEVGANPELLDAYGRTPLQAAREPKVVRFLSDFPRRRVRRSVPELPIRAYRLSAPPLVRNLAADVITPRNHSPLNAGDENVTSFGGFDSWLTLANVFFGRRHSKLERYKSHSSSLRDDSIVSPWIRL